MIPHLGKQHMNTPNNEAEVELSHALKDLLHFDYLHTLSLVFLYVFVLSNVKCVGYILKFSSKIILKIYVCQEDCVITVLLRNVHGNKSRVYCTTALTETIIFYLTGT